MKFSVLFLMAGFLFSSTAQAQSLTGMTLPDDDAGRSVVAAPEGSSGDTVRAEGSAPTPERGSRRRRARRPRGGGVEGGIAVAGVVDSRGGRDGAATPNGGVSVSGVMRVRGSDGTARGTLEGGATAVYDHGATFFLRADRLGGTFLCRAEGDRRADVGISLEASGSARYSTGTGRGTAEITPEFTISGCFSLDSDHQWRLQVGAGAGGGVLHTAELTGLDATAPFTLVGAGPQGNIVLDGPSVRAAIDARTLLTLDPNSRERWAGIFNASLLVRLPIDNSPVGVGLFADATAMVAQARVADDTIHTGVDLRATGGVLLEFGRPSAEDLARERDRRERRERRERGEDADEVESAR